MTGYLIACAFALLCLLSLKFGARIEFRQMAAPAAALFAGLAGYAWQGHPALAGHPVQPTAAAKFDERLADKRKALGEGVGPASKWLITSDALARSGDTQAAANYIVSGLKKNPGDADLWVGLGNALLAHADGILSPAADLAYRRALAIAPDSVSANYFYGLAMAQSGHLDEGKAIWSDLARRLPEKSDLRAELIRNIALIDQMISQRDAAELRDGS